VFPAGLMLILASGVVPAFAADEPMSLGTRRELSVDQFLIEKREGVSLPFQHPQPAGIYVTVAAAAGC
jgi:hypothetical protein